MMIKIIIGAIVGILFGTAQVLVLSRVVSAVTRENSPKPGAFIWVMLQFMVNIAAFVGLGFYSMTSLISAAAGMAVASIVVWLFVSKKTSGKES
ncbi:MAG: hypothetical protein AB1Z19_00910 [Eubacteriales bacterium]